MLIKDDKEKRSEILLGFLLVAVGVGIGVGLDRLIQPANLALVVEEGVLAVEGESSGGSAVVNPLTVLQIPMLRNEAPAPAPENNLEIITIEVNDDNSEVLQKVYDRSTRSGLIVQTDGDLVDATIGNREKSIEAKIRIKGDYLDHLSTKKWSFRVELSDNKLFGMSRFSVQHPKTRGYLWEWLVMQVARREGMLAPRSRFVNIVLNGNALGIYYLEEHFTKELLESAGRREGPIVKFDETASMSATEQYDFQQSYTPRTVNPALSINQAEIAAFGEGRLMKSENLARQLMEALDQMKVIQSGIRSWLAVDNSQIAHYQAQLDRGVKRIDSVLDTNAAAEMHALLCMFRCTHGLAWHNRRFYHNPITGLLEPIVYDTLAGIPVPGRGPLEMNTYTTTEFLKSSSYHNQLFIHLARMTNPRWLGEIFDEFGDELDNVSALLKAEGMMDSQADSAAVRNQLWDQQVYLRETLRPNDAINFESKLIGDELGSSVIQIIVWNTTRVPIALRGFRYENGRMFSASSALVADSGAGYSRISGESGAVVLPSDNSRLTFRLPADERQAMLSTVDEIKKAVVDDAESPAPSKASTIAVEYRLLTESEQRVELIELRNFEREWMEEGARPAPPTLEQALEAHSFLFVDKDSGQLRIKPGVWDVDGDLVLPSAMSLHVGPGVTLRFDESAALITGDALIFKGTASNPIRLEPKPGLASWSGVTVLRAPTQSLWEHVHVRDTNIIRRGGWMMTGGVTFYRCPVQLLDCSFTDAHGEDALNAYGTEVLLERVTIDTCASDAFDGDFITGTVRDCTFINSVEDAVDVSGSNIDVVGSRFIDIGDKAISAGENSVVRARDCVVESASIAVASKDFSKVEVDGLLVKHAENYAFAAYVKKPEYGPCSIFAVNVTIENAIRGNYLIQIPCTLSLNGQIADSVEVDVKQMYEDKILGK
ncbi:MAG: hypothetical protein ACI8TQ_001032 [Planctomycetota bacterium]|jgi:hypothetical protein